MNILDHKSALEAAYKELKMLDVTYLNPLNDLNDDITIELEHYISREYAKDENGCIKERAYTPKDLEFEKKLIAAITLSEQEKTKKWPKWLREKKTKAKINGALECARHLKLTYNHLTGKVNSIDYETLKKANTFVNIVSKVKHISGRIALKAGVKVALTLLGFANPASWVVAGIVILWDLTPNRIKQPIIDKVKELTQKAIAKLKESYEKLKEKGCQFVEKIADKTLKVCEKAVEKGKKVYNAVKQVADTAIEYASEALKTTKEIIFEKLFRR